VLGGVHFPSDVAAGKVLGTEVARLLLANDRFKAEFADAKKECLAAAAAYVPVAMPTKSSPELRPDPHALAAPPVDIAAQP
jgi:membrane-associated phospholipid phosphatase